MRTNYQIELSHSELCQMLIALKRRRLSLLSLCDLDSCGAVSKQVDSLTNLIIKLSDVRDKILQL